MLKTPKSLWVLMLLLSTAAINTHGSFIDDESETDAPQQNARVARIKFLNGEAKIKRSDNDSWENATRNLPLVEGDELSTEENSRIEIQFDKNTYLRLAQNSFLKITNLQEEGIAISLSEGTLNLSVLKFKKDKGYFEIDAPNSTIAVQKEGNYRIDAGSEDKREVRVVVSKWGQARVYSDDSGFNLKNGRSATLSLDGEYAGEWETSRSSRWGDDFDEWVAERDALVERNLRNSYYNRYYDDNIHGADDLNDHGEWIYSRSYGYVWRPYNSSISIYANWSPYRYGHWRWLPYYGWTWVNDEPWGWATYHYGRWIHVNGYWAWSPYSRNRRSRSFWRPAIVYIAYIGNNFCWYPLPYGFGYYDYNRRYRNRWRRNRDRDRGRRNDRNGRNGGRENTPTRTVIPAENIARANRNRTPHLGRVPRGGVVSMPASEFGRGRKGIRRPPLSVAEAVLRKPRVGNESPPLIPSLEDLNGKLGTEVLAPQGRTVTRRAVKTGAGERKIGEPLDEKLRRKTVYGNRTPQIVPSKEVKTNGSSGTRGRSTGVFDRTKPRNGTKENVRTKEVPRSETRRTRQPSTSPPDRKPDRRSSPPRNRTRTERSSIPNNPTPKPRRTAPSRKPRSQPNQSKPRRSSPPKSRESKPKNDSKQKNSTSKSKSKKT